MWQVLLISRILVLSESNKLFSKVSQYFKTVLCAVKGYIGTSGASGVCIKIKVDTKNGHSLHLRKEGNGQLNASSIFDHSQSSGCFCTDNAVVENS